jgi:hypothetical protein
MKSLILFLLIGILHANFLDNFLKSDNNTAINQDINQRWSDVKDDLLDVSKLYNKKSKAPQNKWFGTDKGDIQDSIENRLNDILDTLLDNNFKEHKKRIKKLNSKISDLKDKLLEYQENSIMAPTKSKLHTTKSQYKSKIKETKDSIKAIEKKIEKTKQKIKGDFSKIAGVNLSSEQVDALLSTVYGDDIIQSTYVLSIIKNITEQILQLMKMSNENLIKAKRYYGMHLGSVELIYLIQKKYIQKIDTTYLPKIDSIIANTKSLMQNTEAKIDQNSKELANAYKDNLKNQALNLKVAKLYKEQLLKYKNQILLSLVATKKNLELARNTYETVSLSDNLYSLIDKSKSEFEKIIKLQIPKIEPFKNIQMAKKFKDLTNQILQK